MLSVFLVKILICDPISESIPMGRYFTCKVQMNPKRVFSNGVNLVSPHYLIFGCFWL